jgi:hypothetical protein
MSPRRAGAERELQRAIFTKLRQRLISVFGVRVIAEINFQNGGALNRGVLGASDEHIH